MRDTIDMAREAGIEFQRNVGLLGRENISTTGSQSLEKIERLVALVRADEREQALAAPVQEFVCSTGLCHYKTQTAPVREPLTVKLKDDWRTDDFGNPIIYDTNEVDEVTGALTGDEGEEDALTVLNNMVRYVSNVWPGKTAMQVLIECEEAMLTTPPAQPTPMQEPVAWMHTMIDDVVIGHRPADLNLHPERWMPLYKDPTPCQTCQALARTVMMDQTAHDTTPPTAQRQWVGLPFGEICEAEVIATDEHNNFSLLTFARAIEAKLKEKNT